LSSYLSVFPLDVKAAASWTFGSQPCEKLWLSACNARADNTVINYCTMFCSYQLLYNVCRSNVMGTAVPMPSKYNNKFIVIATCCVFISKSLEHK
jgi:hypothetical protein